MWTLGLGCGPWHWHWMFQSEAASARYPWSSDFSCLSPIGEGMPSSQVCGCILTMGCPICELLSPSASQDAFLKENHPVEAGYGGLMEEIKTATRPKTIMMERRQFEEGRKRPGGVSNETLARQVDTWMPCCLLSVPSNYTRFFRIAIGRSWSRCPK